MSFIPLTSVDIANTIKLEDGISFTQAIGRMLYALGDVSKPLPATVALVETVVREQMRTLLFQADEVAGVRGSSSIAPEDILYLMRNNKMALKRLLDFLSVRDERKAINSFLNPTSHEADLKATKSKKKSGTLPQWEKGRVQYCLKFLAIINISPEDLSLVEDTIKLERNTRADRLTSSMNRLEYQNYYEARREAFTNANTASVTRFTKWLNHGAQWTSSLSSPVVEILSYLSKETIACLVDIILTVREERCLQTKDFRMIRPNPITPSEIREAMRRFHFQHASSLTPFSRDVPSTIYKKLIAIG